MKQPEDTKTAELALETKRGRGRPTKANALTPAERAKRYRDAHRHEKNTSATDTEITEIKRAEKTKSEMLSVTYNELAKLRNEIEILRQDNSDLTKQVSIILSRERKLYKELTALKKVTSQKT